MEINKLYHCDCRDLMKQMPDNFVDLIVTDPPYGLNYNDGDLAHNWEKVFGGKIENMQARPIINDDEKTAMQLFRDFLKESKRILKPGACCCCCCGGGGPKPLFAKWTLWMDKYLDFKQAVVWDKGGLGMGIHYRRNYEFMLIAKKPGAACIWNGGKKTPNIIKMNRIIPQAKQHPTEKPVNLMAYFILLHSNKDSLVFDPFVGHGSTLVAAIKEKRNWIGSEILEECCEIANKRIKQEQPKLTLF